MGLGTAGRRVVSGLLPTLIVLVAYSNHFRNHFHFDDLTIVDREVYLREGISKNARLCMAPPVDQRICGNPEHPTG
jgi:hypothetical protein